MMNCSILINQLQQITIFCLFSFICSLSPLFFWYCYPYFFFKKASQVNTDSPLGRITIGPVEKGLKMSRWDGFTLIDFYSVQDEMFLKCLYCSGFQMSSSEEILLIKFIWEWQIKSHEKATMWIPKVYHYFCVFCKSCKSGIFGLCRTHFENEGKATCPKLYSQVVAEIGLGHRSLDLCISSLSLFLLSLLTICKRISYYLGQRHSI